MSHVYKVGERVRTKGRNADHTRGAYEIVRLMPASTDDVPQYRVKGPDGERVMQEKEIDKA